MTTGSGQVPAQPATVNRRHGTAKCVETMIDQLSEPNRQIHVRPCGRRTLPEPQHRRRQFQLYSRQWRMGQCSMITCGRCRRISGSFNGELVGPACCMCPSMVARAQGQRRKRSATALADSRKYSAGRSLYGALVPSHGAHAAWRAAPWTGWPPGRGSRREDQHRAGHPRRHGRGARRQPGDSGGYGRAHAAAMLADRQRQALQANTAEVRDPSRCYADDRSRTLWSTRRSCRAIV